MKSALQITLFSIAILAFSTMVWGDAFLVDPVVLKAKPNGVLDMGRLSPGEKVDVIFNKNAGYGKNVDWKQARITNAHSVQGFVTRNSDEGTDSLIARVETSVLTPPGTYDFPVELVGVEGELINENYTLRITIQNDLLNGSLSVNQLSGGVNEPSTFTVLLVNDSSAPAHVEVIPALPQIWAHARSTTIEPHSFVEVPIVVTPRFAGPKTFDIRIVQDNGETLSTLKGTIVANPTMQDRYAAGLYGFPFFTISLVANYLVNAFVSFAL
jgi:hypothetical protein